jgi:hypothetical protein
MAEDHDGSPQESSDRPPTPHRRRSHAGRVAGALIALGAAGSVGVGLHNAGQPLARHGAAGASCGGTERWDVKVGNDPDARDVSTTPENTTVSALNAVLPGAVDSGGRMAAEKREYRIQGYLALFKHEADSDYHLVITDSTGGYSSGHSVVVEIPDPNCFSGKHGDSDNSSEFSDAITQARSEFESKTADISGTKIPRNSIAVTVTGVAFFDFMHGQTGHALEHPGEDGQSKVIELHPVTSIEFTGQPEQD